MPPCDVLGCGIGLETILGYLFALVLIGAPILALLVGVGLYQERRERQRMRRWSREHEEFYARLRDNG